jgi:hypothetical protein
MIPSLLVGSALLVLFSPWMIAKAVHLLGHGDIPYAPKTAAAVSYQKAMADLATVRLRLLETKQLDDKVKAAIDTLTLALVAGSDQ